MKHNSKQLIIEKMESPQEYDISLKIILLGKTHVGKSSMLCRYSKKSFDDTTMSSAGIESTIKSFIYEGKKIRACFYDTSGQERFRTITSNYLKGAHGAILVYDITEKDSFDMIETWYSELNENNSYHVSTVLFGNKTDLEENREVPNEIVKELAEKIGCTSLEGSAKTGENINTVFEKITMKSVKENLDYLLKQREESSVSIKLELGKIVKKKKRCC